jgi:hypothetical protein
LQPALVVVSLRLPCSPLFRIEGDAQLTTEFRLITPKPLPESPQLAYLSSAGLVSPTEIITRQPHLISLTYILLSYLHSPSSINHHSFWCCLSSSSLFPVSFCILNILAQQHTLTTCRTRLRLLLILSILVLVQLRFVIAPSCSRDTTLPFRTPAINLDLSLYPLLTNYLRDFINYQLYTHISNWCS